MKDEMSLTTINWIGGRRSDDDDDDDERNCASTCNCY